MHSPRARFRLRSQKAPQWYRAKLSQKKPTRKFVATELQKKQLVLIPARRMQCPIPLKVLHRYLSLPNILRKRETPLPNAVGLKIVTRYSKEDNSSILLRKMLFDILSCYISCAGRGKSGGEPLENHFLPPYLNWSTFEGFIPRFVVIENKRGLDLIYWALYVRFEFS